MFARWTFGMKLGGGFAVTVLCTLVVAAVTVYALDTVERAKDEVITTSAATLIEAAKLDGALDAKSASARAFLLVKEDRYLARAQLARDGALASLRRMKARYPDGEGRHALEEIERLEAEHQGAVDRAIAQRKAGAPAEAVARQFEDEIAPRRTELDRAVTGLVAREQRAMDDARAASAQVSRGAKAASAGIALVCTVLAALIGLILTRGLSAQVGAAVQSIQSSSTELQAAAGQQASGSREHASALTEITTTIRELLSTSEQIADGAQRVSRIAENTAGGARAGDAIVQRAHEALAASKSQVELIVQHMLDLGRKSQQVGGVLDIINELAEQTNILAINATIEAAGAGEAGKRFSVVADEIRKLADRVARSTREIRTMVDEIRAAVNTTVMTTEGGAKAVDGGTRQFGEVLAAFRQIVTQVQTTMEAAREIELSTKQQSTAIDQVNLAVAQAAQAARESEASAEQTLQTSSELAELSRRLAAIVRSTADA